MSLEAFTPCLNSFFLSFFLSLIFFLALNLGLDLTSSQDRVHFKGEAHP